MRKLSALMLQSLCLLGHVAWDAGPLVTVDFRLFYPVLLRLRRTSNLRGNRTNRKRARTMRAQIVEKNPQGALAHFRGKFVHCLVHDALSFSRVGASGKPRAVQTTSFDRFKVPLRHFLKILTAVQRTSAFRPTWTKMKLRHLPP